MFPERSKEHLSQAEEVFGVKADRTLGYGGYGMVWELKENDEQVLKITSDPDEIDAVSFVMDERKKGRSLDMFPAYYGLYSMEDDVSPWGFILREKVHAPCHLPWEEVDTIRSVAVGGQKLSRACRRAHSRFPRIARTLRSLRRRGLVIIDIRTANMGHTLKSNQYRDAGDLVLFDFQLWRRR